MSLNTASQGFYTASQGSYIASQGSYIASQGFYIASVSFLRLSEPLKTLAEFAVVLFPILSHLLKPLAILAVVIQVNFCKRVEATRDCFQAFVSSHPDSHIDRLKALCGGLWLIAPRA